MDWALNDSFKFFEDCVSNELENIEFLFLK